MDVEVDDELLFDVRRIACLMCQEAAPVLCWMQRMAVQCAALAKW